ncbi:MFS transporter [Pararhizobium gei]|uniref:MFS transporter n=1 Tax=Pararhizobium gei TaxID=1395951 RepID=UPI003D9C6C62
MSATAAHGEDWKPETAEALPAVVPPPVQMGPLRAAVYMATSVLLFVTQGLGLNLLNANIYQLQGSLSATTAEIAWLSAAYMAPYASLSIGLFKIRSQFGLRRFAELSVVCFVLASVLNIFVSDLHPAIVVRFLSGMAAAPLSTLGFLYMLEAFPPARKLSVGISLALMNTTLAAPLARIISPELMDLGGWHALYVFELGLALIVLPLIYLLPLTSPPRVKVIQRLDILSYLLLAACFGCLAVFLTLGRIYWWFEAPWLGLLLALAIACLTVLCLIELPRKVPLVDLRWLVSRENLHMAAVLLLFRVVSSEQTTTAANFYMQLGLLNDQTQTLYAIILLASIAGGLLCTVLMMTRYVETAHVMALALIASGALLDSQSTSLTRPEQMYLSQAMVAAGAAMFLPPVMSKGFAAALSKGVPYILNFLVIFLFTQSIGSLCASAALGTFVTIREKFHSNVLVEHVLLTDPAVAARVSQLSSVYGKVVTDLSLLKAEGLVLLGQQITREANILAYNDAFLAVSMTAFAGLLLLLGHLVLQKFVFRQATPVAVSQT